MLTFVICVLGLAVFIAWALVAGLGNPRPQVEGEGWPFGLEIIEDPNVPLGTALLLDRNLRAYMDEQRLGMMSTPPNSFVITNIAP